MKRKEQDLGRHRQNSVPFGAISHRAWRLCGQVGYSTHLDLAIDDSPFISSSVNAILNFSLGSPSAASPLLPWRAAELRRRSRNPVERRRLFSHSVQPPRSPVPRLIDGAAAAHNLAGSAVTLSRPLSYPPGGRLTAGGAHSYHVAPPASFSPPSSFQPQHLTT